LDRLAELGISEQSILEELGKCAELGEISRASITLVDDAPTWNVEYVMKIEEDSAT